MNLKLFGRPFKFSVLFFHKQQINSLLIEGETRENIYSFLNNALSCITMYDIEEGNLQSPGRWIKTDIINIVLTSWSMLDLPDSIVGI